MFDLSLAELALIVVVAVVCIGPKELPVVLRAVSKTMRALRGLARDIRRGFDDLARESGLEDEAHDFTGQMRLIKGDDGKLYESYEFPKERRRDG